MEKKNTTYRVTDYIIVSPRGIETEALGFTMATDDEKLTIELFNEWKETLIGEFRKTNFKFGDKKPSLIKIESLVIA